MELVKEAQKGEPFLFCFYTLGFGHAIVALDCTTGTDGNYYIRAYDNNFPDEDVTIVVSSDYESCYEDVYYYYYGYYAVEFYKNMSKFDLIDTDGPNNDMNVTYKSTVTLVFVL